VAIPAAPDLAAQLADFAGASEVAAGEAFDPSPENIEGRVIRRQLPSGMKLALLPKKTRGGTVVAQLSLRWGDEASKAGRSAACSMASAMLSRGTHKRTREQLRDELDRLRASVSVAGDGASIQTLRQNLPAALALAAEMLRDPAFPENEFEQAKRQALMSVDSQRTDPQSLAGLSIGRHLHPYPPEHWEYTPTLEERADRLRSVSLDEVRRCYRDLVGASHSELAVVGDFDPEEVTRLAAALFGDWKSPTPYRRIPARYFDVQPMDHVIETPDKANAVFRAGLNLRVRDDHPDYPALVLGNYLLGGSSDARLARRIREKEGLSYSVGSWLSASSQDEAGEFGVYAIYAPQNRARVQAARSTRGSPFRRSRTAAGACSTPARWRGTRTPGSPGGSPATAQSTARSPGISRSRNGSRSSRRPRCATRCTGTSSSPSSRWSRQATSSPPPRRPPRRGSSPPTRAGRTGSRPPRLPRRPPASSPSRSPLRAP
jgi:zinc protease